ncbi:MAG: c-type cytochrome [Deltaproteobacteria bacterium]|nr:c-type cytochrome [Deltaproteobacteria bacterium]
MLSKSAARTFFLVGTFVCFFAFILLTLDTVRRVPKQTNADQITDSVKLGKKLWEDNNCMGCHTLYGEGAYYAPELTKVYSRRGDAFIRAMLTDPESMYPGERKMVQYHFTDEELDALVNFFKYTDGVDLNGFPPEPDLNTNTVVDESGEVAAIGTRPKVFNQMCLACHALQGQGGAIGPSLDGVGSRMERKDIYNWLKDPISVKKDSMMPKLPLSDEDLTELSTFLSLVKE